MKRTKFTLLALSAVLSLAACSKKDDTTTSSTPSTPTTSVTPTFIGTWKTDAITSDVPVKVHGVMTTDILESCQKDDLWSFKDGGVWEIDEGAVKCNSSNSQIGYSQWTKSNDTLTLGISTKLPFKIVSVGATTLKMSYDGYYYSSSFDSTKNVTTYTFTRK